MVLLIALALVIGFGVATVFAHGNTVQVASHMGMRLDAVLGNAQGHEVSARWYDNPSSIGFVAGGAVLVAGIVVIAGLRPKPSDASRA